MGVATSNHVENPADDGARRLHELLTSFDMIQNVNMPTHRCNGTLDLVITFADYKLDEVTVDPPGIIADHSLVVCRLPVEVGSSPVVSRQVRAWRQVDRDELRRALQNSALCQPVAEDADVDTLFSTYDQVLRDIADRSAPLHNVRRRADRRAPWFDDECRAARRDCRQCERRYRRSSDVVDRRAWVDAARRRFQLYRSKKETYWSNRVSQDGRSSARLWRSLSTMLGKNRDTTSVTQHTADEFAEFFQRKVDNIWRRTSD